MARLAIWIGNIRKVNDTSGLTTAVELDEAIEQIDDPRILFMGQSISNNDTTVSTTTTGLSSAAELGREQGSILLGAVASGAVLHLFEGESQVMDAGYAGNWSSAVAAVTTRAKVSDATTGKLRWRHGSSIYALGWVHSTSSGIDSSLRYVENLANVNWK